MAARAVKESGVLLEGDGVAAACVARLLTDAGIPCVWQRDTRPRPATILISGQTQHLLRSLFPPDAQHTHDLFDGFAALHRRIVLWGDAAEVLDLPHQGIVVPEAELVGRLWQRIPRLSPWKARHMVPPPAWKVQTMRTSAGEPEMHIGCREAHIALATLKDSAPREACWMESVATGWLFLLPCGEDRATLIAVGERTEILLESSRLVARQIVAGPMHQAAVLSHPRMACTFARTGVIRCGTAAMSFDPLCGEGAGNAVREAFLAAAVVKAALDDLNPETLVQHYTDRLRRGFLRHLEVCRHFYSTGGHSHFWTAQVAELQQGIGEVEAMAGKTPSTAFRLVDRALLPG